MERTSRWFDISLALSKKPSLEFPTPDLALAPSAHGGMSAAAQRGR